MTKNSTLLTSLDHNCSFSGVAERLLLSESSNFLGTGYDISEVPFFFLTALHELKKDNQNS